MGKLGFWDQAENQPERVVLIETDGTQVRAGELLALSHRVVHAFQDLGLQPGDVVATALGNGRQLLACCLAALQAGWYFAALRAPVCEALLKALEARLLIAEQEAGGAVPCYTVGGSFERLLQGYPESAPRERRPGDLVLLSSGSRGQPKVVKRPLRRLTLEKLGKLAAVHLSAVCGIRPESGAVHLVASPLYHSASLLWCLDHLHLGHRVVFDDGAGAESMLERMAEHRVTGSLMVPTHFYRLLGLPRDLRRSFDPSDLRHVVHTGAPCAPELKKAMLDWWGPVIYEVYGAAEGAGTRVTPEEWLARPGTVGRSFGRVKILRPDGGPCDPGEIGRVHLKAAGRPFSLEEFFWVGDLGYLDEEDYLFLRGREDRVILSGGCKVYPIQVEAVLQAHPQVRDVRVAGAPDPEWGARVEARVVAEEDLSEKHLRDYCIGRLDPPQRPRSYLFVDRIVENEKGLL